MKKSFFKTLVVSSLMAGPAALADGFVCQTVEGDLSVRIFNHTQPNLGTRNAAVMIVSDNTVQVGNRTIAKFTDTKSTIANSSFTVVGNVDLRVTETRRGGELISGTRLNQLDTITVEIDHAYGRQPLKNGELTKGLMTLAKRNGAELVRDLECERYLKSE